jgi:hypothetical protein
LYEYLYTEKDDGEFKLRQTALELKAPSRVMHGDDLHVGVREGIINAPTRDSEVE